MQAQEYSIPINLIKKEKENNSDYLINNSLQQSTNICITENSNTVAKKKTN